MKEYSYNPDPRAKDNTRFKSFKELKDSDEWKSDKGKYVFREDVPIFCEGFDIHVLTFETLDELFDLLEKDNRKCLLKLQSESLDNHSATLMEYRWDNNEDEMDESGKKYLQENLGDRWQNYNWWWVLGEVSRKDGNPVSDAECLERLVD